MPTSYQGKLRDKTHPEHAHSQTLATNLSAAQATVADAIAEKGSALYWIGPDEPVSNAVALLRGKKIGALLVLGEERQLVGILSERDIVRQLDDTPGETLPKSVHKLMSTEVQTTTPDESLVRVLRRMTDGRFRHMPVIEDGEVTGMVSIGDVVNFRLKALEYEALQLKQLIVG